VALLSFYLGNCTVEGQVLTRCGQDPRCATTCVSRFFYSFCPKDCGIAGVCACPPGTVIDEDSNKCVPESECPESELLLPIHVQIIII